MLEGAVEGSTGTASTTFTATVASGDLAKLTTQWVLGPRKYGSANILVRLGLSALVNVARERHLAVRPGETLTRSDA
ncbi:MAG TPA: hypothetical protein VGC45_08945 [Gryllotalpicola sp.]